jgi:hypothetical protein
MIERSTCGLTVAVELEWQSVHATFTLLLMPATFSFRGS